MYCVCVSEGQAGQLHIVRQWKAEGGNTPWYILASTAQHRLHEQSPIGARKRFYGDALTPQPETTKWCFMLSMWGAAPSTVLHPQVLCTVHRQVLS